LKKVSKKQYHEKCNHYNQNKWRPIMARVNTKNHPHSKTRLSDYHDNAANVTNSACYSDCATACGPIATSK